ncbi:hypothetical protein [Dyadobacter chenwenxiniae]|nr:hypothetical protein [Dyadobacter chenwenxiniae]
MKAELTYNEDIDLPKVFQRAACKITDLVRAKLEMVEDVSV